jgi:hypothetical protein
MDWGQLWSSASNSVSAVGTFLFNRGAFSIPFAFSVFIAIRSGIRGRRQARENRDQRATIEAQGRQIARLLAIVEKAFPEEAKQTELLVEGVAHDVEKTTGKAVSELAKQTASSTALAAHIISGAGGIRSEEALGTPAVSLSAHAGSLRLEGTLFAKLIKAHDVADQKEALAVYLNPITPTWAKTNSGIDSSKTTSLVLGQEAGEPQGIKTRTERASEDDKGPKHSW